MKKLILTLLTVGTLLGGIATVGCNTTARDQGVTMAKNGQTTMVFNFEAKQPQLNQALVNALKARKWTVTTTTPEVLAFIEHGGQSAKIRATVTDNKIEFDTKGSKIGNDAYVPINFVKVVVRTVRKELSQGTL